MHWSPIISMAHSTFLRGRAILRPKSNSPHGTWRHVECIPWTATCPAASSHTPALYTSTRCNASHCFFVAGYKFDLLLLRRCLLLRPCCGACATSSWHKRPHRKSPCTHTESARCMDYGRVRKRCVPQPPTTDSKGRWCLQKRCAPPPANCPTYTNPALGRTPPHAL